VRVLGRRRVVKSLVILVAALAGNTRVARTDGQTDRYEA